MALVTEDHGETFGIVVLHSHQGGIPENHDVEESHDGST